MIESTFVDQFREGFELIAGVDEAGRGPLAGPVTAACVVLKPGFDDFRINDSKKLSPKAREELFQLIQQNSLAYSIVSVGPKRIDRFNIREATRYAMGFASKRVAKQLNGKKINYLIDGNMEMRASLPQRPIIKGDSLVQCIAAASILAKVTRDGLMKTLDTRYSGYGLAGHKGYPTKAHKLSIKELGPSRIHRESFSGVKEHIPKKAAVSNLRGEGRA